MTLLDTHVHVWDASRFDYPWLAEAASLAEAYQPDEIDRAGGMTTRMVFVEADRRAEQAVDEARWIAGSSVSWPELAGIVAAADLGAGDRAATLDALGTVDPVVGVRHLLQSQPADAWPVDALAEGLHELRERNLAFDACVRHEQLPALAELLDRAPETRTVLDHLGKPPLDAGLDSAPGRAWRDSVRRVAELPNVFVKLSGLAAETHDLQAYDRHADAFIAAAVDLFGPQRAMIGSDWPVSARVGVGTTMEDWVSRIRRVIAPSPAEWTALAEGSGTRFYALAEA